MNVSDLLPAFDFASRIWADHEEKYGGDDAPDVRPGDCLDAATELQLAIVSIAAHVPATDHDDLTAKEKIADHIDRVLHGSLTRNGEPITVDLRRSIACDRALVAA